MIKRSTCLFYVVELIKNNTIIPHCTHTGTAHSDTKCETCEYGFFSDVLSHIESCKPWTVCAEGNLLRNGTATDDNRCGNKTQNPRTFLHFPVFRKTMSECSRCMGKHGHNYRRDIAAQWHSIHFNTIA